MILPPARKANRTWSQAQRPFRRPAAPAPAGICRGRDPCRCRELEGLESSLLTVLSVQAPSPYPVPLLLPLQSQHGGQTPLFHPKKCGALGHPPWKIQSTFSNTGTKRIPSGAVSHVRLLGCVESLRHVLAAAFSPRLQAWRPISLLLWPPSDRSVPAPSLRGTAVLLKASTKCLFFPNAPQRRWNTSDDVPPDRASVHLSCPKHPCIYTDNLGFPGKHLHVPFLTPWYTQHPFRSWGMQPMRHRT